MSKSIEGHAREPRIDKYFTLLLTVAPKTPHDRMAKNGSEVNADCAEAAQASAAINQV